MLTRTIIAVSLLGSSFVTAGEKTEPTRPKRRAKAVLRSLETFDRLVREGDLEEAAELVDELAKSYPGNAAVRIVARQIELLEAQPRTARSEPRSWQELRANRSKAPAEMTVRTYAVADLVVPIPRAMTLRARRRATETAVDRGPDVDFDSLVDLIESTVEPESWKEGSIQPNETTLSLVVRNTAAVHDQLGDLLSELRRLQDVQVTVEMRYVSVPASRFEKIGVDFDFEDGDGDGEARMVRVVLPKWTPNVIGPKLDEDGHETLNGEQTGEFLRFVQDDSRTNTLFAPKVTLFNGQSARIVNEDMGEAGLLVQAVASSDRRRVRLAVARDGEDSIDVLASAKTFSLLDGHTAVIDQGTYTFEARVDAGVPMLDKIPYVSRLFKNTAIGRETHRRLLLVTPRVIVQEEEEEMLMLTPSGILSDLEEEPVLGIE